MSQLTQTSIIVIVVFMLYYSLYPSIIWLVGIPLLFLITSLFLFGLSLLLATINLFFRDLERLITLAMMMMFYATPILYPATMLPEEYTFLLYANPFTPFVMAWKELFLQGTLNFEFILFSVQNAK